MIPGGRGQRVVDGLRPGHGAGSQAVDGDDETAWLPGAPVIGSSLHLAGPSQALDEIVVGQRQTADGSHISEAEINVDGVSRGRYQLSAGRRRSRSAYRRHGSWRSTLPPACRTRPLRNWSASPALEVGAWSLELDPLHEAVGRCVPTEARRCAARGGCRGADRRRRHVHPRRLWRRPPAVGRRVSAGYGSPGRGRADRSICSTATTIRHLASILSRGWSDQLVATLAHGRGRGAHGPFMLVLAEAAGQA